MTALTIMGLLDERLTPRGTVTLDGTDMIKSLPRVKRKLRGKKVSMIFQEPMTALDPLMTVERQVAEACSLEKARELLREVGVELSLIHI